MYFGSPTPRQFPWRSNINLSDEAGSNFTHLNYQSPVLPLGLLRSYFFDIFANILWFWFDIVQPQLSIINFTIRKLPYRRYSWHRFKAKKVLPVTLMINWVLKNSILVQRGKHCSYMLSRGRVVACWDGKKLARAHLCKWDMSCMYNAVHCTLFLIIIFMREDEIFWVGSSTICWLWSKHT